MTQDGEALRKLAASLLEQGQVAEAETAYRESLRIDPGCAEAHFKLGNLLSGLGRTDEAIECYRRAVAIDPGHVKSFYNLGNVLKRTSRPREAEAAYRQALASDPGYTPAPHNLGVLLLDEGRHAEAEILFREALRFDPGDASTLCNLGLSLQSQGRLVEAEPCYLSAIEADPGYATAHNNLGTLHKALGRIADAEACYRRALALDDANPEAWNNLGVALKEQGNIGEATSCYRSALAVRPTYWSAYSNLLLGKLFDPDCAAERYAEAAREFGRLLAASIPAEPAARIGQHRPGPLRVGLVSGDLRNHSVGHFIESWVSHLDAGQIALTAYPSHHAEDELTHRIRPSFAAWRPICGLADDQAARLIQEDGIDLLLDMSGHTAFNRLPLFARRPAPVQASWLGYCATTGLSAIDYILADDATLPVDLDPLFEEQVWRLPKSYLCFTPPRGDGAVSSLPALSNGFVTFGSFNNFAKLNSRVIALWAAIMSSVANSRLLLKAAQFAVPEVRRNILDSFAAHGIGEKRVLLETFVDRREDHLAAYHRIDVALDPFPYNGVTTTAEAMWMGVPVLTLAGDRFVSRQGVGMLTHVGLQDWIAATPEAYVAKATGFAADPERLARTRAGLRAMMQASPLLDAGGFAGRMTEAFHGMCSSRLRQGGIQPVRGNRA